MAQKLLKPTGKRKIAAKKSVKETEGDSVVLVGTYREKQLAWIKNNGIYNYPLTVPSPTVPSPLSYPPSEASSEGGAMRGATGADNADYSRIKELWLYAGAKAKRHCFAAEFVGIQSKDEFLAANPTYAKKVGKPSHAQYAVFKTKPFDYGPKLEGKTVVARAIDFATGRGQTKKIAAAISRFHADGEFAPLADYLPADLAKVSRPQLRVCEAAVQLDFVECRTDLVTFGQQAEIKVGRRDNKARFEMFRVKTVKMAREIAAGYIENFGLQNAVAFGLPEVDDRYAIWRVPVTAKNGERIGEVVIDAVTTEVDLDKSSAKEVLENRLLGRSSRIRQSRCRESIPHVSTLRNTVIFGSSETTLRDLPEGCVDLVFTSPPYYNARPEYADYFSYDDYLNHMKQVIHECGRLLNDGRFFVLNVSPVLIRRASRNEASRRIAVPFDFHRLFIDEGFEFIDDIIWVKPEGAGWATGRGRRFSADRNPCQYKAVPVTEYVLVYRKKTEKLIDWLIRKHPNQEDIKASKIKDGYEVTNLWRITPAHSKVHPAIFPLELALKVIQYYSFRNDVVLDPFGGIGTTGRAAAMLGRRFALVEREAKYVDEIKKDLPNWFPVDAHPDVNWIGTDPVDLKMNNLFS